MVIGVCYNHPSKPSVAYCTVCGKGLCEDCYDTYCAGTSSGQALCFDCTEDMVQVNANIIEVFRNQVKSERKWMIIGMVIGAILGMVAFEGDGFGGIALGLIFGAAIGGSLWTIGSFVLDKATNGTAIDFFVVVVYILGSPIITAFRFFKRKAQIEQCDAIINDDVRILQEMRDYFEYTQVLEENAGDDLATLANQEGVLFGNTYVNTILSKGEQEARTKLRQGVAKIATNSEITKSFTSSR